MFSLWSKFLSVLFWLLSYGIWLEIRNFTPPSPELGIIEHLFSFSHTSLFHWTDF